MKNKKQADPFDIIELMEAEMVAMWASGEIVPLIEQDHEFVQVILEGIHLEKPFWGGLMVIGEA